MSSNPDIITAAVLVIGDEILSGRTKDKNIGYIADYLTAIGIDLKEVRVVADEAAAIVDALNALRAKYTYVFTTGGIGPTHDKEGAYVQAFVDLLPTPWRGFMMAGFAAAYMSIFGERPSVTLARANGSSTH